MSEWRKKQINIKSSYFQFDNSTLSTPSLNHFHKQQQRERSSKHTGSSLAGDRRGIEVAVIQASMMIFIRMVESFVAHRRNWLLFFNSSSSSSYRASPHLIKMMLHKILCDITRCRRRSIGGNFTARCSLPIHFETRSYLNFHLSFSIYFDEKFWTNYDTLNLREREKELADDNETGSSRGGRRKKERLKQFSQNLGEQPEWITSGLQNI